MCEDGAIPGSTSLCSSVPSPLTYRFPSKFQGRLGASDLRIKTLNHNLGATKAQHCSGPCPRRTLQHRRVFFISLIVLRCGHACERRKHPELRRPNHCSQCKHEPIRLLSHANLEGVDRSWGYGSQQHLISYLNPPKGNWETLNRLPRRE